MSEIVPKQRARHVQGSCRPRDVPRRAAATLGGQRVVDHESRQTRSFRFLGQSRGKKPLLPRHDCFTPGGEQILTRAD